MENEAIVSNGVGSEGSILLVEEDISFQNVLYDFFIGKNYDVSRCSNLDCATSLLKNKKFNLILSDVHLAGNLGINILPVVKEHQEACSVMLMTTHSDVEMAVKAIKKGALDFLQKPLNLEQLEKKSKRAILISKVKEGSSIGKNLLVSNNKEQEFIGECRAIQKIKERAASISKTEAPVIISGESGTGKEVFANYIHNNSDRRDKPFVAINCGALPRDLIESELFGHVKGSFTGATQDKKGIFESANGGTVFLDEIGEMPLDLQVKLLRVLQEKKVMPIGQSNYREIDNRIIAATNRDLLQLINEGKFREDLYYRLSVLHIELPPLREREDDITILAHYFLTKYAKQYKKDKLLGFTDGALHALLQNEWKGNIRELKNVIQRAVILTNLTYLTKEELFEVRKQSGEIAMDTNPADETKVKVDLKEQEKVLISDVLKKTKGNVKEAAKALGMNWRTLYRRIHKYNLHY